MEAKYREILQILLRSEQGTTANELSYHLNVSSKTIRNYINAINENSGKLIHSSNKGYTVDREQAQKVLNEGISSLPEKQPDRVLFLLKKLLQTEAQKIDLYDVSEELAVSIETIRNDLGVVKEKVVENQLFIVQKKDLIGIEGMEKDKRKLLSKLLSGEFNKNLLNLEILKNIFPTFDLKLLAQTIRDISEAYNYFINDYALLNLVLEISIEIDRMQHNFMQSDRHNYISQFSQKDLALVEKIANEIEQNFAVRYTDSERKVLANIILSSLTKVDYSKLKSDELVHVLDQKTLELIQQLKSQMSKWQLFDVENNSFLVKFSLHIKNLLIRLASGYSLKNPLTNHIKYTCPLIFEHAVELGNTISKFTDQKIGEDEMTFLALHIGSIMGENDYLNNRIKCVLFLPNYYDYSHELIDKIEKEFNQDLVINQIVSSVEEIDVTRNDFLINVGAFFYNTSLYEVQITPFYTKNDGITIKKAIEKNKVLKRRDYLREHLSQLTEKELFFKEQQGISKETVIQFMSNCLIEKGYVHPNYFSDVNDRESQSSTAFGKVAVPHSLNMDAKKTTMAIMISEKGIQWDEYNKVNLVLLFAIKKEERAIFFNVFDSIVTKLMDPKIMKEVLESDSLEALIEQFLKYL